MSRIINSETVSFEKLGAWCENTLNKIENTNASRVEGEKIDIIKAEENLVRYFENTSNFVDTLTKNGLMNVDANDENRFNLKFPNNFVRTEVIKLTYKNAVFNENNLVNAIEVGNNNYNEYKENKANMAKEKSSNLASIQKMHQESKENPKKDEVEQNNNEQTSKTTQFTRKISKNR